MSSTLLKIVGLLALAVAIIWSIQYRIEWLEGKIWLWGFKYRRIKYQFEQQVKMIIWLFFAILAEVTSPKYWNKILAN